MCLYVCMRVHACECVCLCVCACVCVYVCMHVLVAGRRFLYRVCITFRLLCRIPLDAPSNLPHATPSLTHTTPSSDTCNPSCACTRARTPGVRAHHASGHPSTRPVPHRSDANYARSVWHDACGHSQVTRKAMKPQSRQSCAGLLVLAPRRWARPHCR